MKPKTPNIVPEIMIPDGHFCENPTSDCLYKTMWWFHHYVSVSPRRCPGPAQHYHRTIHVMTLCIRLWSWIMWFSHWHTLESWHTGFHYPYYIFDVCTFLRSFALRRRAGSATRWLAVNCSPPIKDIPLHYGKERRTRPTLDWSSFPPILEHIYEFSWFKLDQLGNI